MSSKKYRYLPFPNHETPSQLNSSQFFVSQFSELPCCNDKLLHRHDCYEIHWLSDGVAEFVSDFESYTFQDGVLVFVAPGQIHTWEIASKDKSNLIVIAFDPQLLVLGGNDTEILTRLPYFDPVATSHVKVPDHQKSLFNQLFSTVLNRYQHATKDHLAILSSYLNVILAEANMVYSGQYERNHDAGDYSLTQAFHVAISMHYRERKQIQDYADLLGVTTNHLVESIRKRTGKTPGQWQQERVLLEAKRLLAHTDDTIAEIAYDLSFKSATQFGKWFKNITQTTPGGFRKEVFPTK